MRKLFWGLGLCWAFVFATTAFACYYAARHPHSFIGRVMHGASYASAKLNPLGGFAHILAKLEQKPLADDEVEGVPADPIPLEPLQQADVNQHVAAAPIVIPDDDVEVRPAIRAVQHESFGPETECPTDPACRAPAVMHFCREEEECEVLPMPTIEENEEEQEPASDLLPTCPDGVPGKPFREAMMPLEPSKSDECREDPHHYQHSGCPNAGRPAGSCPLPSGMKSVPNCDPPMPGGSEEPSEGAEPPGKAAFQSLFGSPVRVPMTSPRVDTMEMRPSDRPAGDHGPGLL